MRDVRVYEWMGKESVRVCACRKEKETVVSVFRRYESLRHVAPHLFEVRDRQASSPEGPRPASDGALVLHGLDTGWMGQVQPQATALVLHLALVKGHLQHQETYCRHTCGGREGKHDESDADIIITTNTVYSLYTC